MLKRLANLMQLDEAAWRRHSNPWSVWTRFIGFLLLILSIWSRTWIEIYSLIPIAISTLWIWMNPKFFSPPKSTMNWASRSVLGERIYINLEKSEIPIHHRITPKLLNGINAIGTTLIAVSLYQLNIELLSLGMVVQFGAKLWYLDRMVWLFYDMKTTNSNYQSWEY